jgi:hypothetical protein
MARSDHILRSEPMEVRFAGFRSDTLSLQEAGWRLAVEEDFRHGRLSMMMRHEQAGVYMVADDVSFNYFDRIDGRTRERLPVFMVRHVARSLESVRCSFAFDNFAPVDAVPHIAALTCKRIEDFALFGAPLVKTEEIIIEPQSVAECLELIRKMQAPELADLRERNARRERMEPINQQRFHAQILSLAA